MIVEKDVSVPMRDRTRLRADVYRPDMRASVPAILSRTPYDRTLRLTPAAAVDPERAVEAGFALVCQDVRGQHGSDGEFYPFRNEGLDGVDTVEWVAEQAWSNGSIGMAGRSYGAATQWLAAAQQPPHLRAIAPVVTGSDYYHGWVYQGGAFQLGFNLFWVHLMAGGKAKAKLDDEFRHLPLATAPLLDRSEAGRFYRDWLAHSTPDEYWQALAPNRHYADVTVPALNIGGWYDLFLGGTLENFTGMRAQARTEAARAGTRLVIGPWAHGSAFGTYPDHSFQQFVPEDRLDVDALQLDFFARHLAAEHAETDGEPPLRIFVMGANRWREEDAWPLSRAREQRWFLRADGGLSREAPGDEAPDAYVYDPDDPAPTVGGPTSLPARFLGTNSGPLDQRKVEERDDVLVYSSEPFERALEVTGPLRLRLHAASSAPDTDFIARLCDVEPDGASRILAEGVLRARYRDGFEAPRTLEPGVPVELSIDLVATSNVFLEGHRIRLSVTSSSFPRFDRNPNTGAQLGEDGPGDLASARQTIFHDSDRASHLLLPVTEG